MSPWLIALIAACVLLPILWFGVVPIAKDARGMFKHASAFPQYAKALGFEYKKRAPHKILSEREEFRGIHQPDKAQSVNHFITGAIGDVSIAIFELGTATGTMMTVSMEHGPIEVDTGHMTTVVALQNPQMDLPSVAIPPVELQRLHSKCPKNRKEHREFPATHGHAHRDSIVFWRDSEHIGSKNSLHEFVEQSIELCLLFADGIR